LWTVVGIAAPVFISQIHHSDRAIQEDFAVYYFLALEMRHGIDPYSINVIDQGRLSGLNIHGIVRATDPPTFLVAIMGPLTLLPLHTAYWIWQCVNMFCLIAALYMMIGPRSGLPTWVKLTFAGIVALYPPVASHFWFGQSKFIMLLLLVLMMRSMARRRNAIAGSALALATLMRVFPIVMTGYLILTRKWRALGWTMAAIVFGAAVTVAFAGWRNCIDFILAIPSISNASWNNIQRDLAAQVFISRRLQALFPHPGLAFDRIRLALNLAVDLSILTATTLATLALPQREDPDSRIFALWVATAVFLLPVAWDYDLTLMLIPFSQLAVVAARGEASRRAIAMAVASYALLIWWEYVALSANEFGFLAMLTAYLSAYWLAVDQPGARRVPIRSIPAELWHRLIPAT
jgi:Glycosyltransferase family 87